MTNKSSTPPSLSLLALLLNSLATIHLVWFYLGRVPAAMNVLAYEQGRERLPFQQRVFMMAPLEWAQHSPAIIRIAASLTHMPGWFPGGVRPEGFLQAVIDLASVALTGIIARRIYQASSRTGLLTPFVYPLSLLMITVTYTIQTNHALRFVYDVPALAFFSVGIYLVYFRRSPFFFAALFVIATLNRETTLLLLPLYWATECLPRVETVPAKMRLVRTPQLEPDEALAFLSAQGQWRWRQLWAPKTLAVILPLFFFWTGWHVWVVQHFAANPSAAGPRFLLNLATLLCPIAWPQLLSAAAFLWPLTIACRRSINDPTLRAWLWLPAAWLMLMLFYGLLVEARIFGELIPYFACTTALIAEAWIVKRVAQQKHLSH